MAENTQWVNIHEEVLWKLADETVTIRLKIILHWQSFDFHGGQTFEEKKSIAQLYCVIHKPDCIKNDTCF